jgi:hypothetical protein
MEYKFLYSINRTCEIIKSMIYLITSRTKQTYFTRDGKMDFKKTVCFILKLTKKTLQKEINDYFKELENGHITLTKQAFSQGRQKISSDAIKFLFDSDVKPFYDCDDI